MKNKQILAMVVILGVLGGIFLVLRARQDRARDAVDATGGVERVLPVDFAADDVRRVVAWAGTNADVKVTMELGDDGWRMPDRFDAEIKPDKIEEFLGKAVAIKGGLRSRSADVLDDYGLTDDEALHVVLTDRRDDGEHHLLVGDRAESMTSSFVRRDGEDAVYLVNADLRRDFGVWNELRDPDPKVWLQLKPMSVEADEVMRLALTTPWNRIVLEKRQVEADAETTDADSEHEGGAEDNGEHAEDAGEHAETVPEWEWVVVEPEGDWALAETGPARWIEGLGRLSGSDIVDPEMIDEYGLDDPGFVVEIGLAEGDPIRIEIGDEIEGSPGERYMRVSGGDSIYSAPKWALQNAIRRARELFDLPTEELDPAKVRSLSAVYADGKGRIRFDRDGEQWTLAEPDLGLLPMKGAVDGAISQFVQVRAEDLVTRDGFDAGIDGSRGSCAVEMEDGTTRTLLFGDEVPLTAGHRFARWEDGDEVFSVQGSLPAAVLKDPARLLDVGLLAIDDNRISRVTLGDGERRIELVRPADEDGVWTVAVDGGETTPASQSVVSQILAKLSSVRAMSVVLDPDANPEFESTAQGAVFVVDPEADGGEAQSYEIAFGREMENNVAQRYLRIDGRPGLFTVSTSFIDEVMRAPEELRMPVGDEPAVGESAASPEDAASADATMDSPEVAPPAGETPGEVAPPEDADAAAEVDAAVDEASDAAEGSVGEAAAEVEETVTEAAESASELVEEAVREAGALEPVDTP